MVEKSELLNVPAFADLPDDQIAWFIGQSEELHLKGGETYIREGDPADAMFIVLEGQMQGRGEIGGETVVFSMKPGDVTGVLPFSRMKQFPINARAVTDARVLRFPASLFPNLVQKMPELTQRLVGLMSDRIRETTRMEQQRDRLAARCPETNQGRKSRIGKPRSYPCAEIRNRETRNVVRPTRRSSTRCANHQRPGGPD